MNNQEKNFNIKTYGREDLQRALEYWTPERIANTKPISPRKITHEELKHYNKNQVEKLYEKKKIISDNSYDSTSLGEPYEVDVNIYPYNAAGKFIFKNSDGKGYHGTAQFVGHCQMLLTAAHLIKNPKTGEEYTDFAFARAYRNVDGNEEQQLFLIDRVGAGEGTEGSAKSDFGFCRTIESFHLRPLALKIGEPCPKDHPMHAIGYPGDRNMVAVDGKRGDLLEHKFKMTDNTLGKGASGGAYMVDLEIQGRMWRNLVVGLNSGSPVSDDTIGVSPLFDQSTLNLFNEVLDASGENPRRCNTIY
ncbi:hypothetical protein O0R52_21795 (plasmid) [Bacillus halotolerans]|uniref:Serine protease n=1 Tax=Bacillus halotolerans TaxID=260554 RepID=A0ABY7I6L4_9BACI|nr:hypothetical protein [Bacillus halotolerans]WAT23633.1 hypothetical protein O0R52_21795 [Bacillus halotolerans]